MLRSGPRSVVFSRLTVYTVETAYRDDEVRQEAGAAEGSVMV